MTVDREPTLFLAQGMPNDWRIPGAAGRSRRGLPTVTGPLGRCYHSGLRPRTRT
jgi:hypothetical protein